MQRGRLDVPPTDTGEHEDEQHRQREQEAHRRRGDERDVGEAVASENGARRPEHNGTENQQGCKELTVLHRRERASGFCGKTIR